VRYPALKANDGRCPEKPDDLRLSSVKSSLYAMTWTYGDGYEQEFARLFAELSLESQKIVTCFLDEEISKEEFIHWLASANSNEQLVKALSYKEEFWEIILWNCTLLEDVIIERLRDCDPSTRDAVLQRNIRLRLPTDLRNLHSLDLFEKVITEELPTEILGILSECPPSAFVFNKNIAEAVALDSRVSDEILERLCSHSSVEVRRTAKRRIADKQAGGNTDNDRDFSTITIELRNEPSGSIMFGKLEKEEVDLLLKSFKEQKLAPELTNLTNNSSGRFVAYEGIGIDFRSDEGFHFGDLSPVTYNPFLDKEKIGHQQYHEKKYGYCPTYNSSHIGPVIIEDCDIYDEEESPVFEDGVYFLSLSLSKCVKSFEYAPYGLLATETSLKELMDEGEICEHYIPIRVPKCVKHSRYGHPSFGIVLDLSFKDMIIHQYRHSEMTDRGYENAIVFFIVDKGNDYLVYSRDRGSEHWETGNKDLANLLSSAA